MIEERISWLEKTDKQIQDGLYTTTKISKHSLKLFNTYCKEEHISKTDAFDEIITFLDKTKMPLSVLHDRYELSQMNTLIRNYHNHTTGILKNFENSFLTHLDANHANSLEFLHKTVTSILEFKTKENLISTQNFKLLRGLVSGLLEDKDASILLRETLLAIQESEKTQELKQIPESEKEQQQSDIKEYVYLTGKVGNININLLPSNKLMYCLINLATQDTTSENTVWHQVALWQGELTQKLGLATHEDIRAYFSKINTGDVLRLKGFIRNDSYKQENKKAIKPTFIVTEILKHLSRTSQK